MKDILKDSNKYRNDINDILEEVFKYLPKLKDWYLEQSVIFDDNKKVLFKALRNDQNEKIGNQIIIDIFLDTIYNYNLIMQNDLVKLTKIYQEKDKLIKETKKIYGALWTFSQNGGRATGGRTSWFTKCAK